MYFRLPSYVSSGFLWLLDVCPSSGYHLKSHSVCDPTGRLLVHYFNRGVPGTVYLLVGQTFSLDASTCGRLPISDCRCGFSSLMFSSLMLVVSEPTNKKNCTRTQALWDCFQWLLIPNEPTWEGPCDFEWYSRHKTEEEIGFSRVGDSTRRVSSAIRQRHKPQTLNHVMELTALRDVNIDD